MSSNQHHHLERALELAAKGKGRTSPNPMVGAVVARGRTVVGEGWHRGPGKPHAEVAAIGRAGSRSRGSTLYVNLEPCVHEGKTPPCVPSIIKAGIKKVVVSLLDPDSRVRGKGLSALRHSGIEVEVTPVHEEQPLNEAYVVHRTLGRPFIVSKSAIALDGRIAAQDNSSKWITGTEAREDGQRLRAASDAVIVGVGTVLADDPQLNVRTTRSSKQPLKVIFDSTARTPPSALALRSGAALVAVSAGAPRTRRKALEDAGAEVVDLGQAGGRVSIEDTLAELASRGVVQAVVEGGATLTGAFVARRLVDKFVWYVAPLLLGDSGVPAIGGWTASALGSGIGLDFVDVGSLGPDIRIVAYPEQR